MIYLLADANSRRKELFLQDADVKFYNNDSERNLRKCKTHQKMSDGFRKESGSKLYCDIMSVIETCKKNADTRKYLHYICRQTGHILPRLFLVL